ncbi:MAG: hypothetical protein A3G89_01025 [Candidatus Doudnabacteria bacterium RIFCSPLOWO2_12_FULL_42_9]|nr:MAG: hypothetical protein A3G89_01025 [Candidatus Doudnabacteria bacterium RIFCSPLOWO2_12_FULL_42_9]
MPSIKKVIITLGCSLFFVLCYVSVASAATLTVSPASGSYTAGQTFTVNVLLNTTSQPIDGVDFFYLKYNPAILQVQDSDAATSGVQIIPGTLLTQTLANTVDAATGKITFSQVTTTGTSYNGSGTVASINFKGIANGTSTLAFDFTAGSTADTNVAGGGTDKLTAVTNGSFTITGGTDPVTPPPPPPPTGSRPIVWADYPSGAIFKYANNATVYIKEGDIARPITDWTVYLNNVPPTRQILVIPSSVTFTSGAVLGLRSGTMVRFVNDPTVYLIVQGKKRPFFSESEFSQYNYRFDAVYTINDPNLIQTIPTVSDYNYVRPFGTWFKYANNPTIYFLNSARLKRPFTTWSMYRMWVDDPKNVVTLPSSETYADGPLVTLPNGDLFKIWTTYYITDNNQLRPFSDQSLISAMGFNTAKAVTLTTAERDLHTIGSPIQ